MKALGGDDSQFIQPGEKETIDQRFKKIMAGLWQTQETFLLVVDNIENPGECRALLYEFYKGKREDVTVDR
ncbi:MAG: hypothetical protein NT166_12980 [Candidatus Aminicenantes bacterium]|nr:hypothetical protein [Candidatus Aminicenantes bacterium]